MTPRKLGFGEMYSDGSGWQWLVHLDTDRDGPVIGFELACETGSFRPGEINPRELAAAFTAIADALGYDLLDEDVENAREILGVSE